MTDAITAVGSKRSSSTIDLMSRVLAYSRHAQNESLVLGATRENLA